MGDVSLPKNKRVNFDDAFILANDHNLDIYGKRRGGKDSERHIYLGAKHTEVAGNMKV